MKFLETGAQDSLSLGGRECQETQFRIGEEQGLGKDWEELSVSWGSALGYPLLDLLYMTQSRAVLAGQGAYLSL